MGGVVSDLFGGGSSKNSSTSQSSSNSYNQAYNYLNGALSPSVTAGTNATAAESSLLTGTGDSAAYQNYLNSTGYQQTLNEGKAAVNNQAATSGTYGSGATAKALDNYVTNEAGTQYQNYLTDLGNVASQGATAASTIAGAGTTSSSQSTGTSTGKSSNTSGIIPGLFG